jgi:hypothetical protein
MLNEDGSEVSEFGVNGRWENISSKTFTYNESRIHLLSDGKFLISNSPCVGCFTRLLSSGRVDESFGTLGTLDFTSAAGVTPTYGGFGLRPTWSKSDNSFVVIQNWFSQSGTEFTIKKFKADLTLNTTFGTNGIVDLGLNPANGRPQDWFVQDDGKIIFANLRINGQGRIVTVFERRLANGQLDFGFGVNGVSERIFNNADTLTNDLFKGLDGSIWGLASNDREPNFVLIKLTSSGASDANWGVDGMIDTGIPKNDAVIAPLPDGGAIYASRDGSEGLRTYRFSATGVRMPNHVTNRTDQSLPEVLPTNAVRDQTGQLIVVGQTTRNQYDAAIIRFGENGILDSPATWQTTTVPAMPGPVTGSTVPYEPINTSDLSNVSTTTTVQLTSAPTVSKFNPSVAFTIRSSKSITGKSLAKYAKLRVLSTSKVTLKVSTGSTKFCKVSGTKLKGLGAGSCKVKVTVKPKKGKITSRTVTLRVTK